MSEPNHNDLIKLNERLDEIISSDKALKDAARSRSAVFQAAADLTRAEHPKVDAAMRERMRAKMLKAVPEAKPIKAAPKKPILAPNFFAIASRVAAVVLILFFIGMMTPPALANSLPGDLLYPAKRGLEPVEFLFAGDELGQVHVHFSHAERRLDENERLLLLGRFDVGVMDDALTSLESGIRIANDNNLFAENADLELRSNLIFSDFTATVGLAVAANLVSETEIARLATSEEAVMAFLPSQMEEPSSSSEVTSTETPEIVPTATEAASPTPEATEVSGAEPIAEIVLYINADGNVNVREGAGTAYPVIAQISPSTSVTGLEIAGDWTQVRLADGRVGWIANFLLSETEPSIDIVATEEPETTLDTGTSSSTSSNAGTSGSSSSDCERGKSCDAPGHSNGNSNNNANNNNNRDD